MVSNRIKVMTTPLQIPRQLAWQSVRKQWPGKSAILTSHIHRGINFKNVNGLIKECTPTSEKPVGYFRIDGSFPKNEGFLNQNVGFYQGLMHQYRCKKQKTHFQANVIKFKASQFSKFNAVPGLAGTVRTLPDILWLWCAGQYHFLKLPISYKCI